MFDEIDAKFDLKSQRGVIFAWGDRIYNPDKIEVTPALMAHERVHGERQGTDPEWWWRRYLDQPAFRLDEEMPAHQAEYREFCATHKDRNARARYLFGCGQRLASPLYGGLISAPDAARAIGR